MARTCVRCGTVAEASDDGLPENWSLGFGERGVEHVCGRCTRENIRAIEGKLPEEWWE